MSKETVALSGGALGTAVLYAAGCVGSKLLILLGLSAGAVGAGVSPGPVLWLVSALGAAVLLYAGWRIYRATPRSGSGLRWAFALVVALFFVGVVTPYL